MCGGTYRISLDKDKHIASVFRQDTGGEVEVLRLKCESIRIDKNGLPALRMFDGYLWCRRFNYDWKLDVIIVNIEDID